MRYIRSPYLVRGYNFKAENRQNSVFNYLNDRPYLIDSMEQVALNYCKNATEDSEVINKFGREVFDKLIRSFLLLNYDTVWNQNHASHIEIETSTVCNWKCEYCPVKYNSRKKQYIDMRIFDRIIDRAIEYQHIKYITLHAYNEPTIDPNFFYT